MNLLLFLLIGLVAGWLAGQIMKGKGFGLVGNLIVGVIGALIGGFLFDTLDIAVGGGIIGSLIAALIGAVILLWIVGLVKKT
ncbi:GlsB/YeaQ/YmgE family stress response membrane protein [candidate division KSB1 bacterium]|nr:GlsB/YeaQ/YmgE family stress response membrane protein [candidate division KSB1 bacterium]NIR71784.1 GlsB/YeaQ/YmgE family stress response membrane protein [candidate division KSB1 bacterium]NIS25766.1 GlsB/YeaQ/YmgE family stress response membrane protein [candidate division KSB1 bacterium]NIT72635.1 GlsB/YeaQ/YmgE family stress response membrane protein [candidate division KSB1 bacterium]NIU26456.1 GlsB/YeaQ/YmgE family stress response membrane protein [candidate division KSB1 bacterium]